MLAAGALIAQQVVGKATRDALFLSAFHVSSLPLMMIGSAVASSLAVLAFSNAMGRRSPARVVPRALAVGTVLLIGEWGLSLVQPRLAAIAVYLHMAAFGATVVSGFWSLVNERFDPYLARRVMGRIGVGASLGGVAGGLLAWSSAGLLPVPSMLALMAAFNVICLVALGRFGGAPSAAAAPAPAEGTGPLSGLRLLREVPYLRDLAIFVALGAATEAILDYIMNARAASTFAAGQPLLSFFALFHTGVGLLALIAQTTLSRPSLIGLGLAGTVALRPASVVVTALLGVADPRLWAAVVTRGAHGVLQNSLFRSGYELLFTPVAERRKRPTKTIVDVGFDRLGTVVGGLLTFGVVLALGGRGSGRTLFALAAAAAVGAIVVSRRLHRGYVFALEESLRSGVVRLDMAEVRDSTTLVTLAKTGLSLDRQALLRDVAAVRAARPATSPAAAAAGASGEPALAPAPHADAVLQAVADLRSGHPEAVRSALHRAEMTDPAVVGHLIPLLANNAVFLEVVRALRRSGPRVTGQLLDALLDGRQDSTIRRRVARVLRGSPIQRAADGLILGLADARFEVRRECALTLARITQREPALRVRRSDIFAAVLRELEKGAAAWALAPDVAAEAEALGDESEQAQTPAERGLAHVFTLLSTALDREPVQTAYWALLGEDAALRGTALEYLENILPDEVSRALWPHLGVRAPAARPAARPADQLAKELLRSSDTMGFSREALKKILPRR
jgi:ATP/ADP translocase